MGTAGNLEIKVNGKAVIKKQFLGSLLDGLIDAKEELDSTIASKLKKCGCKECKFQFFDLFGKPMNESINH